MLTFAKDSSIHGIKFILNSSHSEFVKIFWIFSFLLSFCGFFYYIRGAYNKWQFTPDIMMKTSEKLSKDFPMPAVTVCPNMFAKSDLVNVADIYNGNVNASKSQCKFLLANKLWCRYWVDNGIENCGGVDSKQIDVIDLINESHYETEEALWNCVSESDDDFCEKWMSRMLTPFGVCYTMNMGSADEILSDAVSPRNLIYSKKNPERLQWSLERGYKSSSADFPSRARKGNLFKLQPTLKIPNVSNYCLMQAFTVIFHHPTEIPTIFHEKFTVNHKVDFQFSLTIKSHRTDDYLRIFSPYYRKCYFEGERKLKFFKIYSKAHCELECNANQTVKNCGCSYVAMPRENSMKICHLEDFECVLRQTESETVTKGESMLPCDCFPLCNDVKYNFKMDVTDQKPLDGTDSYDESLATASSTIVIVHDKEIVEEVENFVSYKLQSFISEFGGLLGLFLGCSLLSIVEIFYFIFAYFLRMFRNDKIIATDDGLGRLNDKNRIFTPTMNLSEIEKIKRLEERILKLSVDMQKVQDQMRNFNKKIERVEGLVGVVEKIKY